MKQFLAEVLGGTTKKEKEVKEIFVIFKNGV